jgi:hypothetical protein
MVAMRVYLFTLFLVLSFVVGGCSVANQSNVLCKKTDSAAQMTLYEAQEIAGKSSCMQDGSIQSSGVCNEQSGTWWIDFKATSQKPGCTPACVVDVETGRAEVNWRCTGLEQP